MVGFFYIHTYFRFPEHGNITFTQIEKRKEKKRKEKKRKEKKRKEKKRKEKKRKEKKRKEKKRKEKKRKEKKRKEKKRKEKKRKEKKRKEKKRKRKERKEKKRKEKKRKEKKRKEKKRKEKKRKEKKRKKGKEGKEKKRKEKRKEKKRKSKKTRKKRMEWKKLHSVFLTTTAATLHCLGLSTSCEMSMAWTFITLVYYHDYRTTFSFVKYSFHSISLDLSVSGAKKNACNLRPPTYAFTNKEVTIGTKYIGSRSRFIKERAANVVFGSKVFPVMRGYEAYTCIYNPIYKL